jgi:HK97 gp10 family phage protein
MAAGLLQGAQDHMSLRFSFRISGAREAASVLRRLPGNVHRRVLQKATRVGGVIFRDAAIANAPRGTEKEHPYGRLAANIKLTLREAKGGSVYFVIHTGDAFWGNFQEFGTADQEPKPFMRPAFDEKAGEALRAIGLALGKGVEDEARRLSSGYRVARKSLLRGSARGF